MRPDREVLMIAFHFPPGKGSSGIQRTLKFSRYLREHGWKPIVLTVSRNAYPTTSEEQIADIPSDVPVYRAPCVDTARHLAVGGRYIGRLALPDRWRSWVPAGVLTAIRIFATHRPRAIWSTYPIASAHSLGWYLSKLTRLPWIADFRDPMCQDNYPRQAEAWQAYHRVERRAIRACSLATFTSPTAVEMYVERYPEVAADRFRLLRNGYDEIDFEDHGERGVASDPAIGRPVTLVHSGTLYPIERDPLPFFRAVAGLKGDRGWSGRDLRIVLRSTGHDGHYRTILDELGIADLVELAPAVDYRSALAEMAAADGLLLIQGAGCNFQIPAKAYEYLRVGRPVLALTDPAGDTAALLRDCGVDTIAAAEDEQAIRDLLPGFLDAARRGAPARLDRERVRSFARRSQAGQLAQLLDEVTNRSSRPARDDRAKVSR